MNDLNHLSPVITVDGPSGVGKGTLAMQLADALGWHFLDSGSLYRLTGLSAHNQQIDFANHQQLADVAAHLDVQFLRDSQGGLQILLASEDVTAEIRTEQVGNLASQVAPVAEVRQALFQRQRDFQLPPGLVADGRDMGTVVFPGAELKLFLTASAEERAKRRYIQLKEKGVDVSIARLAEEVRQRDERDTNRSIAPLCPADDAVMIDSTEMTIEEVFESAMTYVRDRGLNL
ncbi:(d)CMP kinase [Gynuella sunshinyii]|uniref:Cytidylate kinase n=1 Tax=Gynuella sunshinyii YC6258 TaxID=1445510 RepID=A0A0C5VQA4_9GAMM|nr:(d)CMP kinase [Gynuella sunshinyii]AJQ96446.1 cytidylate kinase [Gynuella sunshinyii YC6258]